MSVCPRPLPIRNVVKTQPSRWLTSEWDQHTKQIKRWTLKTALLSQIVLSLLSTPDFIFFTRLICPCDYVPILLAVKTFIVGFMKWIACNVKRFCKDQFFPSPLTSQVTFKTVCAEVYSLKAKLDAVFYWSLPKMLNYKQLKWEQGKTGREIHNETHIHILDQGKILQRQMTSYSLLHLSQNDDRRYFYAFFLSK